MNEWIMNGYFDQLHHHQLLGALKSDIQHHLWHVRITQTCLAPKEKEVHRRHVETCKKFVL